MAGQLIHRGKNKWLVRVYLGCDEFGKRKYHNKTVNGIKKEAQAYLNKVLTEKDTGTFIEPSKEILSKYLEHWLQTTAKQRVREKTFSSYQSLIHRYVIPTLGNSKLAKLTPLQIQELYNSLLEKGLSSRTVRYTHSVLRNALEQAVKWSMLYRNPADLVDLPKLQKQEMKSFPPEEASKFMSAIIYSKWKAAFSLLISSGMRPGEVLGLKWSDVNFDEGKVYILRTLSRSSEGWKFEEPKTSKSRRTIPLPPSVIKDLKEHKKEQAAEKLEAENYTDNGLIFACQNGEPLHERNLVRRHFKPLLEKAGLPNIRLYDLRHTCATLLLTAGENPKVVSERLGHASVILTLDTYSHVLPDMQQGAADKLEKLLF